MTAMQTAPLRRRLWYTCSWVLVCGGGRSKKARATSAPSTQVGAGTNGADGRGV